MLDIIIKGGYFMIPLMACSLIAVSVFIDRLVAFWQHSQIDERALRAQVREQVEADRIGDAAVLCANTASPVAAVLLSGLQTCVKSVEACDTQEVARNRAEKTMEDTAARAMYTVESRLWILATIGNSAPLLGMAGTVSGMIASFDVLAGMGGLDAVALASGISEALITTAAGLIIALGAVIPYNVFTSITDRIDLEVDEAAADLLEQIGALQAGRLDKNRHDDASGAGDSSKG